MVNINVSPYINSKSYSYEEIKNFSETDSNIQRKILNYVDNNDIQGAY